MGRGLEIEGQGCAGAEAVVVVAGVAEGGDDEDASEVREPALSKVYQLVHHLIGGDVIEEN